MIRSFKTTPSSVGSQISARSYATGGAASIASSATRSVRAPVR